MKFMTMVRSAESYRNGPPPQALMDGIMQLGADAAEAGVFVEMGGLMPSAAGAMLRLAGGAITVKDGPFTEAKEVIGGYAVYSTASKEEAIAWARAFSIFTSGTGRGGKAKSRSGRSWKGRRRVSRRRLRP